MRVGVWLGTVWERAGVMAEARVSCPWKGLGFHHVLDGEPRKGIEVRGLSGVRCHPGWAALQVLGLVSETERDSCPWTDHSWDGPAPTGWNPFSCCHTRTHFHVSGLFPKHSEQKLLARLISTQSTKPESAYEIPGYFLPK